MGCLCAMVSLRSRVQKKTQGKSILYTFKDFKDDQRTKKQGQTQTRPLIRTWQICESRRQGTGE